MPPALSFDLLRGFASACRTGSLSRAARQLHRSQSALSMQVGRLEALVGCALLRRTGRGVQPTRDGEILLGYAERLLALGDEAAARLGRPEVGGKVRIGMPEEIAVSALPSALGRFRAANPGIRLEVNVENTVTLEPLWLAGSLDIMIGVPSGVASEAVLAWSVELRWVCGPDYKAVPGAPVDVVVFSEPCVWRRRLLDAMAASGLAWRIVFTSPSVAAIQAAVDCGLGITLLNDECIRRVSMRAPPGWLGLPPAVTVQYGLYAKGTGTPAIDAAVSALSEVAAGAPRPAPRRQAA